MIKHKTRARTPAFVLLLLLLPACLWAQSSNLDVPYYVQGKDSSWADEMLGNNSSVTIRYYGCALTCISMVTSHFSKKELNPSDMNQWLKKQWLPGWMGWRSLSWRDKPELAGACRI